MDLLADPAVRDWLAQYRAGRTGTAPASAAPVPEMTLEGYFAARLVAIHNHLVSLTVALPLLPGDFASAGANLVSALKRHGVAGLLMLFAALAVLGSGLELLLRRATEEIRTRNSKVRVERVSDRLRAVAIRAALDLGSLGAFAVGSIGAFLIFEWPPVLRNIALAYLFATLALRSVLVIGRLLFAPDCEELRIVPVSTAAAWFWYRRMAFLAGWFAVGRATLDLLSAAGFGLASRQIVAYALGLVLLGTGLEIAWRRPRRLAEFGHAAGTRFGHIGAWLLSLYFVALWLLWVASAMPGFWLAVVLAAILGLMGLTRRSINHILRPPHATGDGEDLPRVQSVFLERGARAALIIGGALVLARAWNVDLVNLTAGETALSRLLAGALSAVVIVLLADLAWQLVKTAIDRRIAEVQNPALPGTEEERRRTRVRTLLPVLRSVLLVVIVAVGLMMALSHLGVQIGPLITGAGIIGVAVGFGAQTLVKDIISGTFYLLDDAFRVGEYIVSGSYKGTVESFSFRSVKLRHHRGPLYTVPFGTLGAIQNMSRDWVIDKLAVGVTYDSDLDLAKKLIKQIGKELAEDPEFAPHIIEPLKMQGVEQFGDFAIQIRLKMMTRPGEQFSIRRRAYSMIKAAFDAHGVKFAFPTVQVAHDTEPSAAAAHKMLESIKSAAPKSVAPS